MPYLSFPGNFEPSQHLLLEYMQLETLLLLTGMATQMDASAAV